jgi:ankyrin repeat protein
VVRELVHRTKVDLEVGDRTKNRTPLLLAVRNGHAGVVKLLLKANTNTEAMDNIDYQTPLLLATKRETKP